MCIPCRPHVDVHKGGWSHDVLMYTGWGVKNRMSCGPHKWMTPYGNIKLHHFLFHIGILSKFPQPDLAVPLHAYFTISLSLPHYLSLVSSQADFHSTLDTRHQDSLGKSTETYAEDEPFLKKAASDDYAPKRTSILRLKGFID